MKTLRLAVKREYFDLIKAGVKPFEFRLYNEYWIKRLVGVHYDHFMLTLGYPAANETDKILEGAYLGYEVQTITHGHFGKKPVEVFAIYTDGLK